MTITQNLASANPDPYIELLIIDCSAFGGPTFRITPSSDTSVGFGSYGTFIPFPVQGSGWAATAEQPPRPKLTLSNVTKYIQPYLQTYDGLAGAKVTRLRTTARYLDSGASPDATQTMPIEVYYIDQMSMLTKDHVEFILVTAMDLSNVKLPLCICLKDNVAGDTMYAPGLSTVRYRG